MQDSNFLPSDHIGKMTQRLSKALRKLGLSLTWQHCPWIGPIGPALLEKMFILSQMAHRLPPRGQDHLDAVRISESLEDGPSSPWSESVPPQDREQLRHIELSSRLYWHATALLCDLVLCEYLHLLPQSSITHFQEGTEILLELSQTNLMQSVLLWPLIVLGTAIDTYDQMMQFRSIIAGVSESCGLTASNRVSALLEGMFQLKLTSPGAVSAKDLFRFVASQGIVL